jgi:glucose-6-phosphate 1-dehydrogenase
VSEPRSDALVLFGATGDLAYQQIFPALLALTKRGRLEMPVIGVARQAFTEDEFRARAKKSLVDHGLYREGRAEDETHFQALASRLRYASRAFGARVTRTLARNASISSPWSTGCRASSTASASTRRHVCGSSSRVRARSSA